MKRVNVERHVLGRVVTIRYVVAIADI